MKTEWLAFRRLRRRDDDYVETNPNLEVVDNYSPTLGKM